MKKLYFFFVLLCTVIGAAATPAVKLAPMSATAGKTVKAPATSRAEEFVFDEWEELGTAAVTHCGAPYIGTSTGCKVWHRACTSHENYEQYRVDGFLPTNVDGKEARPLVIDIINSNVYVFPQELPKLSLKNDDGSEFTDTLMVMDLALAMDDEAYRSFMRFDPSTKDFELWLIYYIKGTGAIINSEAYMETVKFDQKTFVTTPSRITLGGDTGMGFVPCEASTDLFGLKYAVVKGTGADAEGKSLAQRIVDNDPSLMVMYQMSGQIMFAPADGPGMYTLAVVGVDGDEKALVSSTTTVYWMPADSWAWEAMGNAIVTENFLPDVYGLEPPTYEVALEKSTTTEGLYRLVDLYGENSFYGPYVTKRTIDFPHYTYLHCENPDACYVEQTPTGIVIDEASGESFIGSTAQQNSFDYNMDLETIYGMDPSMFGTLKEGVLDFPSGTLMCTADVLLEAGYGWLATGSQGSFKVVFPQSGIENIDAGTQAPAEYYNLQGMRVEKPLKGLVIKHQGGRAAKVVF